MDAGRHIGQLELNPLKLVNSLTELFTLVRVPQREFERTLSNPKRMRGDTNSTPIQRVQEYPKPLVLSAQQIVCRYFNVVENQFTRIRCIPSELPQLLARLQTRHRLEV